MKKFRFTLEAVRTVRQRNENEAQEQYARALLGRQQAMAAVEAAEEEIRLDRLRLHKLLDKGCTAAQAEQAQRFHRSLEGRRQEVQALLGQAERRVNATLQAMIAARQQREMVDVYCEKQRARHSRQAGREEQKALDEFAARRVTSFHSASHD